MLTHESLKGIFAAVPIPWDEAGGFDEATFREDVAKLCDSGVHGLYTTGSTGEFYALDLTEFRQVIDAFEVETRSRHMPTQVGCTWINTRGAAKRAAYAASKGVDGIQVALPFWMALSDKDLVKFFKDINAASGGLPIVHYNTERSKRVLTALDYEMILDEVPSLVGTKFTGNDLVVFEELVVKVPQLAHFAGEPILVPAMMLGARGCYSSLALMNPALMTAWYDLCEKGDWERAAEWQRKIAKFFIEAVRPLVDQGYVDAAIDKAMAAVTGFLKCGLRVREPHAEITEERMRCLRRYLEQNVPELLDVDRSPS